MIPIAFTTRRCWRKQTGGSPPPAKSAHGQGVTMTRSAQGLVAQPQPRGYGLHEPQPLLAGGLADILICRDCISLNS